MGKMYQSILKLYNKFHETGHQLKKRWSSFRVIVPAAFNKLKPSKGIRESYINIRSVRYSGV